MDEQTEMYCAFVKGNKGEWAIPVKSESSSVKDMQDDGIRIASLESDFIQTDTMKLYGINVQGNDEHWLLMSPLEPEMAEQMQTAGIVLGEIVYPNMEEEAVSEQVEPKEEPTSKKTKARPKGKVQ